MTTAAPHCASHIEAVEPVREVPIDTFKENGVLWGVYRLKDAPADPLWRDKVVRAARAMKGKHYDGLFQWGDDRIYCSELVWKAYRRGAGIELAPLERIGDLDVSAPPVQRLIKSRLRGRKLNLDEPVVTPGRLYASDKIESVFGYL